ncbi:hypothetical protein [Bacillus mycoides]|uniref:hypothetical protein n=1 Tax=Bacillus mycoides TaxID=1405 RepID=UPI003D23FC4E
MPVACQSVSKYNSHKENRIKIPPANVKNTKEKTKFGTNNFFRYFSLRKALIEKIMPIVSGMINAKKIYVRSRIVSSVENLPGTG